MRAAAGFFQGAAGDVQRGAGGCNVIDQADVFSGKEGIRPDSETVF